jgi:Reverse transcriptase (RNA-dependent DNA polymerase)/Group II intron, maturase-specific domain
VQAALKIVLEPVFEADFLPCSFGFRPRRSAHDALQVLIDESWRGRRWVVETDFASCFESVPHRDLMQAVEERVCDRAVLALTRALLRAGVVDGGSLRRGAAGTPQGGVVSPLLCNAYLHRLDRAWSVAEHGVLVRYADDVVVMCDSREQAEAALAHLTFLARWPSRKAVQHARDRIREITGRKWLWMETEDIVRDLNLFLRGWAGYFRYGNSARVLGQIRNYALVRLASWLSKKGNRRRARGWGIKQVLLSPSHLGLISLDGTVRPPRPFRDWRGSTERRR